MVFGLIDTSYIDWPSNVDAAYLRSLTTRSGLRFTDLGGRLDAGLTAINTALDARLSLLLAGVTTEDFVAGGRTGTMKVQRKSQYTIARPQQVGRIAHMLAIDEYDISLGFTEDGLQEMSIDNFQAQVDAMVEAWQRMHRAEILSRLFNDAEIGVSPTAGATAATSPGFAGSGTGGNVFSGQYPDGTALPGGYTHYYRDTTANLSALVLSMRDRVAKWHPGPYDLLGSANIVATLQADATNFVSSGSVLIRVGAGTAEAVVDPDTYVGVFGKNVRVHQAMNDWSSDHFVVFKTYGPLNSRNALIWKYDPLRGRDAYVRSRELFPLANAVAMQKFGINVNDRTAATLARVAASGVYTAPTLIY